MFVVLSLAIISLLLIIAAFSIKLNSIALCPGEGHLPKEYFWVMTSKPVLSNSKRSQQMKEEWEIPSKLPRHILTPDSCILPECGIYLPSQSWSQCPNSTTEDTNSSHLLPHPCLLHPLCSPPSHFRILDSVLISTLAPSALDPVATFVLVLYLTPLKAINLREVARLYFSVPALHITTQWKRRDSKRRECECWDGECR